MEELTGLQQIQIGVLVAGFLCTIVAGLFAGARWTVRIEGGIERIRLEAARVALEAMAARDENRADHEKIMNQVSACAAPTAQTHVELQRQLTEIAIRFDRLEQRILLSGGT